MKIRLSELRTVLWAELLIEVDLGKIAQRASRSGIRLVQFKSQSPYTATDCIVIVDKDNVMGGISASRRNDGFYIIDKLWANRPTDAVVLLMSALSVWKKIDPSRTVSPAARSIIKRYYEESKDDPKRVQQHIGASRTRDTVPYLNAGYLDAGDFNAAPILVQEDNRNEIWKLYQSFEDGFDAACEDDDRTGFNDFTKIAKQGDMLQLAQALAMSTDPPNAVHKIKAANEWIDANPAYISKIFQVINRVYDKEDPDYAWLMGAFEILGIT